MSKNKITYNSTPLEDQDKIAHIEEVFFDYKEHELFIQLFNESINDLVIQGYEKLQFVKEYNEWKSKNDPNWIIVDQFAGTNDLAYVVIQHEINNELKYNDILF